MEQGKQSSNKASELLEKRRSYYKACFKGEAGEFVLDELRKMCYADYTTFDANSQALMAYREGMRAVYLYIKRMAEGKTE